MNQFPFVAVQGSPYDRGRQYGLTAESRIRKSVAFYAAQLERLGLVGNRRQEIIAGSIEEIAKFEPTYIDEMRGIADGAGLALGPVDKVDSQISGSMIQDCLLGGGFGSRRPDRYGMADHRGAVAHRAWKKITSRAR